MISPKEENRFVKKLLDKLEGEFEPEIIPVQVEQLATIGNCYTNVENKVKKDGGKICYGWAIWQGKFICEAEHHAVWETNEGDLIDITPRTPLYFDEIMFVPCNDDFVYNGQSIDNVKINMTTNPIVDDYIKICEVINLLYNKAERIDDIHVEFKDQITRDKVTKLEEAKEKIYLCMLQRKNLTSSCFCGSGKTYTDCHRKSYLKQCENL